MRIEVLTSLLLTTMTLSNADAAELVRNGSFEDTSVSGKDIFAGKVAGWNGGGKLTYIASPGTADDPRLPAPLYGPFPKTSPDGGKFVIADGDPTYRDAIWQTIAGLTVGAAYNLHFFQAAGQWAGRPYPVATTERWAVTFGKQTRYSDQFKLPFTGVGRWQAQTLSFTATAKTQILSFLADGTPGGAPPMVLLDGVSLSAVPEPSTWAMMVVGFAVAGAAMRTRRRGQRPVALV